ncbi:NAD-dependent epimerase/dehydratase family protein [Ignavibacteria bacterium]|nr:NAD-dependent epimerase/dehydratase family protein [Bacteroidota bacterium]MCZ2132580.1 NAD-dependent epimerase/dehydratase family protein [Bacteroidota bacterium]
MQVLLTGATGFIGSHVADMLLEKGYDVRCLTRKTSNLKWLERKRVHRVEGSLDLPETLADAVRGADIILHVAGLTSAKSAEEFMRGNRDATRNLLEAAERYSPNLQRFLHVSSLAVCGPAASADVPVTEELPCRPITTYGRTKLAAEEVVHSYASKIPTTIVRPPAVYGPRDSAVLTFFQSVAKGIVPLIGFDKKLVSLVNGLDLARGIIEAAESPAAVGQTYFISSDEFYAWEQIGEITRIALGKKFAVRARLPHSLVFGIAGIVGGLGQFSKKPPVLNFEKGRDITRRYWICSTAKARRDFGYKQKISIEDGIRQTVDWYKFHKWL